jgi:adenine-specific DNA methylase
VTPDPEEKTRHYRLPNPHDYQAVWKAIKHLTKIGAMSLPHGLSPVPDEPTPLGGGSGAGRAFSVQKYGMMTFGDLFTSHQKLTLLEHAQTTSNVIRSNMQRSGRALTVLASAISKLADTNSVLCTWQIDPPRLRATFARQALPMTWDFAEASPLGEGAGNYALCLKAINEVLERLPYNMQRTVEQGDATHSPLPSDSVDIWFTDPPYYDAVPYADLSDFFFVWLKRTLPEQSLLRDPSNPDNPLTPKTSEIVQDEVKQVNGRPKDRFFFEEAMAQAFGEGWRILSDSGIGCVVFAHTTTEGWEALLSGMIRGGWVLTGSWPIATELESRQRARDSAALATSVHLVCRPRSEGALTGDWGDVFRELPNSLGTGSRIRRGHNPQ